MKFKVKIRVTGGAPGGAMEPKKYSFNLEDGKPFVLGEGIPGLQGTLGTLIVRSSKLFAHAHEQAPGHQFLLNGKAGDEFRVLEGDLLSSGDYCIEFLYVPIPEEELQAQDNSTRFIDFDQPSVHKIERPAPAPVQVTAPAPVPTQAPAVPPSIPEVVVPTVVRAAKAASPAPHPSTEETRVDTELSALFDTNPEMRTNPSVPAAPSQKSAKAEKVGKASPKIPKPTKASSIPSVIEEETAVTSTSVRHWRLSQAWPIWAGAGATSLLVLVIGLWASQHFHFTVSPKGAPAQDIAEVTLDRKPAGAVSVTASLPVTTAPVAPVTQVAPAPETVQTISPIQAQPLAHAPAQVMAQNMAQPSAQAPAQVHEPVTESVSESISKMRFFVACKTGNLEVVKTLISQGQVDPSFALDQGSTGLMAAARSGHAPVVSYLVRQKVSLNAQDPNGMTALMWAAYNGHEDITQILLKKGADTSLRRDDGQRAIDLAKRRRHVHVVALLKAADEGTHVARPSRNVYDAYERQPASSPKKKRGRR